MLCGPVRCLVRPDAQTFFKKKKLGANTCFNSKFEHPRFKFSKKATSFFGRFEDLPEKKKKKMKKKKKKKKKKLIYLTNKPKKKYKN